MRIRPLLRIALLTCCSVGLNCSLLVAQKPNVKTVDFKNFKLLDENPTEMTLLKEDFKEYDVAGKLIHHILHNVNAAGELVKNMEIKKTWNDIGLLEEIHRFDENGYPTRIEKVQYDKKSKRVSEIYSEPQVDMDKQFTKTYTYTETGKPSKNTTKDQAGTVVAEEIWKYNEESEEIRFQKWEMRGAVKYEEDKKTYYTKEGKLDKAEKETKDGKDVYKEITLFDGYKVKETVKYKNGEVVSQFGGTAKTGGYTGGGYDPSKTKTLMEFGGGNKSGGFGGGGFGSLGGSMAFDIVEETDDEGRKTKVTELDAEGLPIQITYYEYDKNGNTSKIKREAYMEGEVASTEEEITEYDDRNSLTRKATVVNGYTVAEDTYAYQYY